MDELGDRLEDLGIEIGVAFLHYAELCETFWRIKKLGMSARCCTFYTARHQNSQTVAPKVGKTVSHLIAGL